MIYSFSQIIQKSARLFPEKDAFRCGKEAVTYLDLDKKTNQLARFLLKNGVQKGDRIGIYLNRCVDTPIAIYGIMKAGGVYVPLDPGAPISRTQFLLTDCGIQHLITNTTQRRKLAEITTGKTGLQSIVGTSENLRIPTFSWDSIFQLNSEPLSINILEHDLAYIMYTSGSTGIPKGIMHTHHSGLAYAKLAADLYKLNHKDRIGNHAPLHFDISTLGYFSAPLVGATTIIVSDAHAMMPASLASLIEQEKLTVWYSVPLALIQMLQNGIIEQRDFSTLKWILYGGEPFPLKHIRKLIEVLPQATFSNVYGPAEVNQCTYYNFKRLPEAEESVPLGQAWENTEILILDEEDNIQIEGEAGELLVRSATRMSGYWKQPELTKKKFYIKQVAEGYDQIFYRTGDLVRLRTDGNLIFLGRKDRQIKIRGYRVELDETEVYLLTHEAVQEAAVFVMEAEDEKQIQAAVILNEDCHPSASDIKLYLQSFLPKYAVPSRIKVVQQFPRTSTGKIDRKILKQNFETGYYEK